MTGGQVVARPAPDLVPRAYRLRWLRLRLALGVVWAAVAVAVLLVAPLQVAPGDLQQAVQEGRVDRVTVVGGLPDGAEGTSQVDVRWREHGLPRGTTFVEERPRTDDEAWADAPPDEGGGWGWQDGTDAEGRPVVRDVVADLRSYSASVQVEREPRRDGTHLWDQPAPSWLALALVVLWATTIGLLVEGPQPWRATRWAWFWLGAAPFGLLAFLLLSGPLPGRWSVEPAGRRLTGGWALLLSMLLAGVLPAPLWW